jgi:hypothetical protein
MINNLKLGSPGLRGKMGEEIWGLREESYDVVVWGITGSLRF